MPLKMSLVCCLQAAVLARAPSKPLFLVAQSLAPLLDPDVQPSSAPPTAVAAQSILFALSLLLSAAAHSLDPYHGSSGMNALVKSLAPVLCLALDRSTNNRHWLAALVSYGGFLLATYPGSGILEWSAVAALLLLFGGTLAGVFLGRWQRGGQDCWYEMSLGSTCWCLLALAYAPPPVWSQALLVDAAAYGALSFLVQRLVRQHNKEVGWDPLRMSLALNERRALTIGLTALDSSAPARLLIGAAVAVGAASSIRV